LKVVAFESEEKILENAEKMVSIMKHFLNDEILSN